MKNVLPTRFEDSDSNYDGSPKKKKHRTSLLKTMNERGVCHHGKEIQPLEQGFTNIFLLRLLDPLFVNGSPKFWYYNALIKILCDDLLFLLFQYTFYFR